MARLLFIYPLIGSSPPAFRYAETAKRLYNEKVDVRILTVGKDFPTPSLLAEIPHTHIFAEDTKQNAFLSIPLQSKVWHYLLSLPKDGLSIFMNGLDLPVVFWACRRLNLPLIAQFPEGKNYSVFYRKMIGWVGKSPKTALLYGSQAFADNYRIRGFDQHIISMPLPNHLLLAAQEHREISQANRNSWFSVIIGCREASRTTLRKISILAGQCPQIKFQCWFFNQEELFRGSKALQSKANISCLRPHDRVSLYKNNKLYIEIEEPKLKPSQSQHLHYIREAMEFGLPALLLKDSLGTEWITPGVNGYILGSGQLDEMASKIRLLAHSNLLYDRLSKNASRMAQRWHPPKVCKALSDLLLAGKTKCTYIRGLRQSTNYTT